MATPIFKPARLANVGTTAMQVYAAPASKISVVVQLDLTNVKDTPQATVNVWAYVKSGGTDYYLAKNTPVLTGESLQVIYGQKLVLQPLDQLWVKTSIASGIDVNCSVLEDV